MAVGSLAALVETGADGRRKADQMDTKWKEEGRGLELLKQERESSGDWKQPEAATARAIEEDKTSATSFHTVD